MREFSEPYQKCHLNFQIELKAAPRLRLSDETSPGSSRFITVFEQSRCIQPQLVSEMIH